MVRDGGGGLSRLGGRVVEAVTIMLALGLTRGWRSTFLGTGAATVVLTLLTAILGTALQRWIDIGALEIVFIVMTIGASSGQLGVAAAAAAAAVLIVRAVGVILRHPLSRVPENTIKFAVGILLTTFSAFWVGEGIGLHWLGDDLALLWLLAAYGLAALLFARLLETQREASQPSPV